jgi:hypothetical protein
MNTYRGERRPVDCLSRHSVRDSLDLVTFRLTRNEAEAMTKIIKPAAIALLVFMIAFRPEPSAQAVQNIVGVLGDIANGFGQFVTSVLQ